MRIYMIVALCFALFAVNGQDLPDDLKKGIEANFPERDSIKWKKNINVYEVHVYKGTENFIGVFSLFGDLRETKYPLKLDDLPQVVLDAVEEKHKEVECYDIYRVVLVDGTELYELKTDTEDAGYLVRTYVDGRIHLSKKIHQFEDQ